MAELLAGDLRVGVDLGGTKVHSVVFNGDNKVLAEDIRLSGFGNDEVVGNLIASIHQALNSAGNCVAGHIGVGTPGTVDQAAGSVSHSLNLGIEHLNLRSVLGEEFSCDVQVHNDVNATAAGLATLHPELHSLAYLNFGTGLAAGFVLEGKVVTGFSGLSGEIGHIPVGSRDDLCSCGQRGCLELFTSWSGLKQLAPEQQSFAELAAAMENGSAQEIKDLFLENVIRAITTVFLSLDPQRVFIGGGLITGWDNAFAEISSAWSDRVAKTALFASKDLANRLERLPSETPVAAIGALGS